MRKIIIAFAILWTMIGQASADPLDITLLNRDTMAKAVAILMTLPPPCTVDNKRPSVDAIALFIKHYGHKGDDAFLADAKAYTAELDEIVKFPEPARSKMMEAACTIGFTLTTKVRFVAGLNEKQY